MGRSRAKNSDVYEIISKNIRKYRREACITQEELAMRANYSHQFIRRIEAPNVKKTFSLDTIYCLSKALNKNFSDMFIEKNDEEINNEFDDDNIVNKV